jgi:hypothetical protein
MTSQPIQPLTTNTKVVRPTWPVITSNTPLLISENDSWYHEPQIQVRDFMVSQKTIIMGTVGALFLGAIGLIVYWNSSAPTLPARCNLRLLNQEREHFGRGCVASLKDGKKETDGQGNITYTGSYEDKAFTAGYFPARNFKAPVTSTVLKGFAEEMYKSEGATVRSEVFKTKGDGNTNLVVAVRNGRNGLNELGIFVLEDKSGDIYYGTLQFSQDSPVSKSTLYDLSGLVVAP